MGGTTFKQVERGLTAEEAFQRAVEDARSEFGNRGDSGTIGTKVSFVLIRDTKQDLIRLFEAEIRRVRAEEERKKRSEQLKGLAQYDAQRVAWLGEHLEVVRAKEVLSPADLADYLLDLGDPRIDDKYGPAGCIVVRPPDAIERLSPAQAEAKAREKYGPSAKVKTTRYKKEARAEVIVQVSRPTGPGVWTQKAGGYEGAAASAWGADVAQARGKLFAAPGEFLFFGWAKC